MEQTIIKIIEQEGIRTGVITIIISILFYVFYHLFLKNYIDSFKKSIETFNTTIKANNEATKIVIFYELQREFYDRREKGYKSVNADERWQDMWTQYVNLGDGKGDILKREWDSLPIR